MANLADFYFTHDELFVIPIEHLSPRGMSAAFRTLLLPRVSVSLEWIDMFDDAFATYWARASELAAHAPENWPPPRLQHVCVVTDPTCVRPYFQPFNRCSWLLYASDFDPALSHREFGAYQLLHVERMGLLQAVTPALVRNLSYWLVRSDDEIAQFSAACAHTPRPDAAAFRELAAALPWVRRLRHTSLKPPVVISLEPTTAIPQAGLLVPRSLQPKLDALQRQWTAAATRAVDSFRAAHARRGRDRAGELCRWLRDAQPRVLLTTDGGRIVWDPDEPDEIAATRAALGGIDESAAQRIRDDTTIIDERSRQFLGSLAHPDALPAPHRDTAQGGLSYLHLDRKLIAYNLREPAMDRLHAPAPPYERFMLAARTIHEWGHLAADAGWIPVRADRRGAHGELRTQLAAMFDEIVRNAPAATRSLTAHEITRLTAEAGSAGAALAQIPLNRMPDYQANLLARRYLTADELETYIRNNVYSLTREYSVTKLFRRLARYAYEYQYLRFSQITDPLAYFLGSTWFAEEYLQPGSVTAAQLTRLLDTVGALCDCYAIDESKFDGSRSVR
ncbi:MAG: hypothetical protein HYR72_14910 [Deltaproteobacteria bacterium]|nr:hypothetical protein [Deltaproteobacteria bacterium]MBI3390896.1 hypothetical protein [Deltaproteobacteria bacterium]